MKEASPSPSQQSSSLLAGMGLFLATAAVSQWIQLHHKSKQQAMEKETDSASYRQRNRRRRRLGSRNNSCDEDWYSCNNTSAEEGEPNNNSSSSNNNVVFSKEAFRRRRLARRMSFEQVDEGTTTPQKQYSRRNIFNNNNNKNNNNSTDRDRSRSQSPETLTEWSIHHATGDLVSPPGRLSQESMLLQQQLQQQQQHVSGGASGQRIQERNNTPHRELKAQQHQELKPHQHTNHNTAAAPPALNNRYHDFHPKYQNWRHFEHYNEHDRAKQKRKIQQRNQQRQQQQQQQQQRSFRQQDAGEGASQNEEEKKRRQILPQISARGTTGAEPIHGHCQHKPSTIDDGTSLSTFDDEREIDKDCNDGNDDSLSVTSFGSNNEFGSGNEFVWTGGHTPKHHCDESSKSACSFGSDSNVETNDGDGSFSQELLSKRTKAQDSCCEQLRNNSLNMNRLAIRSGTSGAMDAIEGALSGSNNIEKNVTNHHPTSTTNADHRMGKFERFYRMLASSVIDDDSSELMIHDSGGDARRHSLSSNSTNFGGTTNFGGGSTTSSTSFDYDGDIEDRHRALRTEYNAQIMPEKLVLIRHGQSMGNVDETFYATTPDNAMPLTDLGWEQARKAGMILKEKIITPGESVHFIVSPYVRTVETFHGIVSAWCDPESEEFATIQDRNNKVNAWYEKLTELGLTWNEDSRIREQDFGNYQNPEQTRRAKEERHRFGAFYYRFHNGESGSDVFDRVSTFLDSLWRSFETNKSQNYVLVTHGIVLRVLMARYFRYTISQLNTLANPRNCEMVVLGHEGNGRLDLEGRCSLELEEDSETMRTVVKGYKFHKRLRIQPKSYVRTVRFRISPMDGGKGGIK